MTDGPRTKPGESLSEAGNRVPRGGLAQEKALGRLSADDPQESAIEIEERYREIAARRCSQEVLDLGGGHLMVKVPRDTASPLGSEPVGYTGASE